MIDDNQLEHFIVDKMIHKYGYTTEIDHYENALSVINFLDQNQQNLNQLPDLIFLDLHMDGCDGWQFLDMFRKMKFLEEKDIQVYIVTSSLDINDITKSKSYPFVKSYIIKPITKAILEDIFSDPALIH